MKLTAVIEREGEGYVSPCPELDVASQGKTIEEAEQFSSPHQDYFTDNSRTLIEKVLLSQCLEGSIRLLIKGATRRW
jgi:hypothetical protein